MSEKQNEITEIEQETVPTVGDLMRKDPEYRNMGSYLGYNPVELYRNSELAEYEGASIHNVMNLLYMEIQGLGISRIAVALGMREEAVLHIKKSQTYIAMRDGLLKEIVDASRRVLQTATTKAVKTLYECMDSHSEKIRFAAAKEVLSRVGISATTKVDITTHTETEYKNLNMEQLTEILKSNLPNAGYEVIEEETHEL